MAHTHEHPNLLLQPFGLGPVFNPGMFSEDLDGVPLPCSLFHAEIDLGKVTLSELVKQVILLEEGARLTMLRIPEDEPGLPMYRNLVLIL